jgi:LacI family transcriptional regulator
MESPDALARATGFRQSVEALGPTIADGDFLEADWTSAGGESAMRARLDRDEVLPEVFACANDQMAVGVIFALQERGRRVPDDVLVTGFDDITLTRYFNPPLTTIRQSGGLLATAAIDALVATIDGAEPAERNVVLSTELVVRGSCGCATDPEEPLRQLHTANRKAVSV